eukprot:Nk52_evm10s2209 gene=Nk52_evmTU10s2209
MVQEIGKKRDLNSCGTKEKRNICQTQNESELQSKKFILQYIEKSGIRRRDRIRILNLGKLKLREIHSFKEFGSLEELWLNDNRLRSVEGLKNSMSLKRLFLQHNRLISLNGALKKVKHLETLLLQDNQFRDLESVVHDIRHMSSLKVLNLFGNPIEEDSRYRLFVIYNMPSLRIFDRREVTAAERKKAYAVYNARASSIVESVKFGRRITTSISPDARDTAWTESSEMASQTSPFHNGRDFPDEHNMYSEHSIMKDSRGLDERRKSSIDNREQYTAGELRLLAAGIEVDGQRRASLTHHRHRNSSTIKTVVLSQMSSLSVGHGSKPTEPPAAITKKGAFHQATRRVMPSATIDQDSLQMLEQDNNPSAFLVGGGESCDSDSLPSDEGHLSNLSETEIEVFEEILQERKPKTTLVFNAFGWQNFESTKKPLK